MPFFTVAPTAAGHGGSARLFGRRADDRRHVEARTMDTRTAGDGSNVLFISHNATDRPYAEAIEALIYEVLDSKTLINVRFSTSEKHGPQGGETWRDWIYRQVVEARTALIVVTPHSLGKPWLMWEAGACRGVTLAWQAVPGTPPVSAGASGVGASAARLIVSLAYGLAENECPDPLRGDQIILGTNLEKVKTLLQRILQTHNVPNNLLLEAGERRPEALQHYLKAVRTALLQAPSLVTEANVQDWLERLEELVRSNRLSELKGFERWMMLAFGRDGDAADVPIDVRLHRRLGELHLAQKDFVRAAEQLDLAWRAAPRDIYVLRPLVEAGMKRLLAGQTGAAEATAREHVESLLDAIKDLDHDAFVSSPDAAALYGKYLRRVAGKPERAADVYVAALRASPNSYYLADLLAQTQLELGRRDEAKATYRQAIEIIDRLGENNVWSQATAATACLALGDVDGARKRVAAIVALGPISRAELDTIGSGLREVAQRSGIAESAMSGVLAELSTGGVDRTQ
jgi:tetratricopeptide (TPR) repeat protein